jgi:hypothetical protein
MNIFVTVFVIEEGITDDLVGPFQSQADALSWIDAQISTEHPNYPGYNVDRSEDGEITMFSDELESDPHGFIYQILTATAPVEIVENEG